MEREKQSEFVPQPSSEKPRFAPYGYTALKESRTLFRCGKLVTDECWKPALQRGLSPQDLSHLRSDFGEGQLGQQSFEIVASGWECELSDGNEKCHNPSTGTIDFDLRGLATAEQIFYCNDHRQEADSMIEKLIEEKSARREWGRNGHGRA